MSRLIPSLKGKLIDYGKYAAQHPTYRLADRGLLETLRVIARYYKSRHEFSAACDHDVLHQEVILALHKYLADDGFHVFPLTEELEALDND